MGKIGKADGKEKEKGCMSTSNKIIVKKMPSKLIMEKAEKDELKDWKPTKIQKKGQKAEVKHGQQQNIASSFLMSLSKPIHKKQSQNFLNNVDDEVVRVIPKSVLKASKLTPEQIKWDIEDQTFIYKQFIPGKNVEHKFQQDDKQDAQIKAMNDLNMPVNIKDLVNNTTKIRQVNLNEVIDKNWKEAAQNKFINNQLWQSSQGLLDGRGNLTKIAEEAQKKAVQIEQEINKRTKEKLKMKNTYGW